MRRISGETALVLAWIVALAASLSVLFIGEVLGQTPCNPVTPDAGILPPETKSKDNRQRKHEGPLEPTQIARCLPQDFTNEKH